MSTSKHSNNPVLFSSEKVAALDEAKNVFIKILDEYIEKNPGNKREINKLRQLVNKAYTEKKISYLLEDRISYLNDYIDDAFRFALKKKRESSLEKPITNLFYSKKIKTIYFE